MFISREKAIRIFEEICATKNVTRPRFAHYMEYSLNRTWPGLVVMYKEGEQDILNGVQSRKADFTLKFQQEAQKEWDKVKFVVYGK